MPIVAVPAVAAVLIALLAALLLWGADQFIRALASIIPRNVPVLGSWIHNAVAAAGSAVATALQWLMGDVIRPVVNLVLSPVYAMINFLVAIDQFAANTVGEFSWLLNSALPSIIRKLENYAHHLYALAESYAHRLYVYAEHYARRLYDSVHAYAHHLHVLAERYAHGLYTSVHAYALHLYRTVTAALAKDIAHVYSRGQAYTRAEISSVNKTVSALAAKVAAIQSIATKYTDSKVASAIKATEAFSTAAIAKAITAVDVDGVKDLAREWSTVTDEITALEGVIATDFPDIRAAIDAIPRAVPRDITAALAVTGALSIPMLRYMRDCGLPNCRNLSKIGRDLQALFKAVEGAGFLALLAELVSDPQGMAREVHDVIGGTVDTAASAARNLLGV